MLQHQHQQHNFSLARIFFLHLGEMTECPRFVKVGLSFGKFAYSILGNTVPLLLSVSLSLSLFWGRRGGVTFYYLETGQSVFPSFKLSLFGAPLRSDDDMLSERKRAAIWINGANRSDSNSEILMERSFLTSYINLKECYFVTRGSWLAAPYKYSTTNMLSIVKLWIGWKCD